MFNKKKEEELQQLSPETIAENKKQRSINRVFGLLCFIALLLLAMLITEFVMMIK